MGWLGVAPFNRSAQMLKNGKQNLFRGRVIFNFKFKLYLFYVDNTQCLNKGIRMNLYRKQSFMREFSILCLRFKFLQ